MELINNTTKTLRDDLAVEIKQGSRLSVAAACFSIYAFQELKKELQGIDELRFIFTSQTFTTEKAKKEKREPVIIPKFSCHIFRHTFASRFCENETNIKVIQEVMGHADVSTTMNIYAEANPDVTKSVIEKLSKNMDIF